MYEQPSLHMELARLKHKDYEVEAGRARLAAQATARLAEKESRSSRARSRASAAHSPGGARSVAHETRLQPAV